MVYPQTFEQKIGFDYIRLKIQDKCVTPSAKNKAEGMSMHTDPQFLENLLSRASQLQLVLQWDASFPEVKYVDASPFLVKLQLTGSYLEESEFLVLAQCLDSSTQLLDYFERVKELEGKPINAFDGEIQQLRALPEVLQSIARIVDDEGRVKDSASRLLQDIRRKIKDKEIAIQSRLNAILREAQQEGLVEEGVELSVREGRVSIPVAAGSKRKIKGLILGESATGKTVYIEPLEIVEHHNQLKELEAQERREIIRILLELSDQIRPFHPEMQALTEFLAEIDFTRAKALYAISIRGCYPYLHHKPYVDWKKARHPILEASLQKENRSVVPLDIKLNEDKHILLISGPNAGGKSVCLKTMGLLQYMLQCGLLIPVSELSETGVFSNIFIDIGDEQSLENDLSTYSSHLQNMKHCLRYADGQSLVLIDEFGTGTEPTAGGAIAEAVLSEFVAAKVFGVITTHYANLKYFAAEHEGVVNGAMMFDEKEIKPLFKLEMGYPGSSFALEIARKTGLPESVLSAAREKMGTQYVGLEKQLREVARSRRMWEEKRHKIQKADAHVEQLEMKYEQELIRLQEEKKQILKQAQKQAAELIREANRRIEQTIREIRESQAEKEKTRQVRHELQAFDPATEELAPQDSLTHFNPDRIAEKMRLIKERQERRALRKGAKKQEESGQPPAARKEAPQEWKVGAKVKLKNQEALGEIVKMNGTKVVVAFGTLLSSLDQNQLELISSGEYKKTTRQGQHSSSHSRFDLGGKRLNFKPTLDIRGARASEAITRVENYLDEAVMLGMHDVSILHGTGTGILKEQIRQLLKTLPYVAEFKDERVELGGAGITLVTLNF